MTDRPMKIGVIYCRVSSAAQTKRGDGLESQRTRCLEYARMKGYTVLETFKDDISGKFSSRPGMKDMLVFVRKHRSAEPVVLIDDVSRLARNVKAHIELRGAIALAGGILESPTVEFRDDADSELQEYILATVAQHQRRKNAEQTVNRMKSRVMNGYWPFQAPVGFMHAKAKGGGKILVRNEPLASIVQEALEGYASGRFQLQVEVKRFLESFPEFPRDSGGKVRNQQVTDILTRSVYAGMVESREFNVSRRKGQHEGLVSVETFNRNQTRLKENSKAPARKDLNTDFILRGFVTCADCGHPLTANWAKGRNGHHAYYHCFRKGCGSYGKSVRRDVLEGEFEELLRQLQPTESFFRVACLRFEDLWNARLAAGQERARSLKSDLARIEREVDQFVNRMLETNSPSVMRAIETRINALEAQKVEVSEKIAGCGRPLRSFDETLRTALEFVGNPYKCWVSEHMERKRMVLKLAFADHLAYARNEGFRTANLALPFKALGAFCVTSQ